MVAVDPAVSDALVSGSITDDTWKVGGASDTHQALAYGVVTGTGVSSDKGAYFRSCPGLSSTTKEDEVGKSRFHHHWRSYCTSGIFSLSVMADI